MAIPERYQSDCKEIVAACGRLGLVITEADAYTAWGEYSESYAAGWLGLPYPDNVFTQRMCDENILDIFQTYKDIITN